MKKALLAKYPWLAITTTLERYIAPDYYDRLLKRYVFDGKHDLDFFQEWAAQMPLNASIIEFGSGTGRVTALALDTIQSIKHLTLVDLSDRMLAACRKRFANWRNITYVEADTIQFLATTKERFNVAYSLWSFSHSVHQTLKRLGFSDGEKKVRQAMKKFLTENLASGGSFLLIHFDSLSEEQRISIKQRRRDNFVFAQNHEQSPSKQLLDTIFAELAIKGIIEYICTHYVGEPLEFKSINEALEYYCNFHIESHFNESNHVEDVLEELANDIKIYRGHDGVIRIKPGCFIYTVRRK